MRNEYLFLFQETGPQGSQAAICVYIRQLRLKHRVSVLRGFESMKRFMKTSVLSVILGAGLGLFA